MPQDSFIHNTQPANIKDPKGENLQIYANADVPRIPEDNAARYVVRHPDGYNEPISNPVVGSSINIESTTQPFASTPEQKINFKGFELTQQPGSSVDIQSAFNYNPAFQSARQHNATDNNIATGTASLAIGWETEATYFQSESSGIRSVAKRRNEYARGSQPFLPGDPKAVNQYMDNIVLTICNPGASTPLTLDNFSEEIEIPEDTIWSFNILGEAVKITGAVGDTLSYSSIGTVKNVGGVTSFVVLGGNPNLAYPAGNTINNYSEDPLFNFLLAVIGNRFIIFANNGTADQYRCNAKVQLVQLGFRNFIG